MSSSLRSESRVDSIDTSNNTSIQNLFDYNRFEKELDLLPFMIYFPFGFCLFLIRLFVGLHALLIASLLPKKSSIRCFILRTMCSVLGIIVKEENASLKAKSTTKIIISNHITNFDHLAVDLVLPCIVPGVWDLPKFLNWGLGFHDFGVKQGRDVLIENVKSHLNSNDNPIPILSYPEGATTNGRVGLLKFSSWLFTLDLQMQPIYITSHRPSPFKISASVLGSRWWSDLFWFLFVPFTIFNIKYLTVVKRNENETPEDFAKRVQTLMANAMRVYPSNYTDSDKVEFAKRLLQSRSQTFFSNSTNRRIRERNVSPNTSISTPIRVSAQLEEMANKVKEVLPQVPINVIQRDIKVTTNIDETITRILDGTVSYTPEQVFTPKAQNVSTEAVKTNSSLNNNLFTSTESMKPLYCGSKTFGKNASERSKSYKERKQNLLEMARLRYQEKHGIILKDNNK